MNIWEILLGVLEFVSDRVIWLMPTAVVAAMVLLVRPMVRAFRENHHVQDRNKDPLTEQTVTTAELRVARKRLSHGLGYLGVEVGLAGVVFGLLPRGLLATSLNGVPEWIYYGDLVLVSVGTLIAIAALPVRMMAGGVVKR